MTINEQIVFEYQYTGILTPKKTVVKEMIVELNGEKLDPPVLNRELVFLGYPLSISVYRAKGSTAGPTSYLFKPKIKNEETGKYRYGKPFEMEIQKFETQRKAWSVMPSCLIKELNA